MKTHLYILAIGISILCYSCTKLITNDSTGTTYSGWFWEKVWAKCQTGGQIIITSLGSYAGSGMSIGKYSYSASLLAKIQEYGMSYSYIPPQAGLKSYCFDGWTPWCSIDECR